MRYGVRQTGLYLPKNLSVSFAMSDILVQCLFPDAFRNPTSGMQANKSTSAYSKQNERRPLSIEDLLPSMVRSRRRLTHNDPFCTPQLCSRQARP
jgi:hypothetical protein